MGRELRPLERPAAVLLQHWQLVVCAVQLVVCRACQLQQAADRRFGPQTLRQSSVSSPCSPPCGAPPAPRTGLHGPSERQRPQATEPAPEQHIRSQAGRHRQSNSSQQATARQSGSSPAMVMQWPPTGAASQVHSVQPLAQTGWGGLSQGLTACSQRARCQHAMQGCRA